MLSASKLFSILAFFSPLLVSLPAFAVDGEPDRSTSAIKHVMRITEEGITPRELTLKKLDSSVFLYNELADQPVDISIRFGSNRVHCHSPRLKMDSEGVFRTDSPLPPNSFAIACFPSRSQYPIEVTAPGVSSKPHRALITVE